MAETTARVARCPYADTTPGGDVIGGRTLEYVCQRNGLTGRERIATAFKCPVTGSDPLGPGGRQIGMSFYGNTTRLSGLAVAQAYPDAAGTVLYRADRTHRPYVTCNDVTGLENYFPASWVVHWPELLDFSWLPEGSTGGLCYNTYAHVHNSVRGHLVTRTLEDSTYTMNNRSCGFEVMPGLCPGGQTPWPSYDDTAFLLECAGSRVTFRYTAVASWPTVQISWGRICVDGSPTAMYTACRVFVNVHGGGGTYQSQLFSFNPATTIQDLNWRFGPFYAQCNPCLKSTGLCEDQEDYSYDWRRFRWSDLYQFAGPIPIDRKGRIRWRGTGCDTQVATPPCNDFYTKNLASCAVLSYEDLDGSVVGTNHAFDICVHPAYCTPAAPYAASNCIHDAECPSRTCYDPGDPWSFCAPVSDFGWYDLV